MSLQDQQAKITYTLTDESPALASYSLLPIVKAFLQQANIDLETKNISLACRILAVFPEYLSKQQQKSNDLELLKKLVLKADCTLIKLPNISASIPQLLAAIAELQSQAYAIPDFPSEPTTDIEKEIRARYNQVLGSAVNPVLREGNSDRRVPKAVKNYAKRHPHSMGQWDASSKTKVISMSVGDFYASEKSQTMGKDDLLSIELLADNGEVRFLKQNLIVNEGDIIDASVLQLAALNDFYQHCFTQAKADDILASLHLKATMMKVSDPIIFGQAVNVYFAPVFEKHQSLFTSLGINANNGLADLHLKIQELDDSQRLEIEQDLLQCLQNNADLAMVDSDNQITNLHVPSHVIIDASMPAMIRSSGKMWNAKGKLQDTLAIIPDRCYAGVYQQTISFCKQHGAFDPATMGSVSNVGLMAQKAEEYGSHDKTFEVALDGRVVVKSQSGEILFEHQVKKGDVWRLCQVKREPIANWVKLAINRARLTKTPAIFWLDPNREHDLQVKAMVEMFLAEYDLADLDIKTMSPIDATAYTLARLKAGKDTISVTGNVLRDYLTDLFPILELGTSSKMLSIVPLMNGGGLFETGAGGSAPKHVQQFLDENHLRWDSLGEFLALAAALEHIFLTRGN